MTTPDLQTLLGLAENEHVEFKRGSLTNKELSEYAVGMGNAGGGVLVLGVTDQLPREVHGLSAKHLAELQRARPAVLSQCSIPIEIQVRVVEGKSVAIIELPRRPRGRIFHTVDGKYLMRVGEHLVGMPEAEIERIKRTEAGALDVLAEPVAGPWREVVSLVEMERLRIMLRENRRDELAQLADEALLGALEVFHDERGKRSLTRVGVLLVGTNEAIRRCVPYHEVKLLRFGADPLSPVFHEDYRTSLVHCIERAETMVAAVNTIESFQSGLFRVDLPRFPRLAWREALANALAHREYGEPGSVAVRIYEDRMEVGSPGGWFGGVSEANVLHTEPKRRNELLASALQKIGLAERSAVGVKRMYREMLMSGKGPPRFRSTAGSVTVSLDSRTVDRSFGTIAAGSWGEDRSLSPEDLLALSLLRRERRATTAEVAVQVQLDAEGTASLLDRLVDRQLVSRNGVGRGRFWGLGPEAYRRLGIEHERPADLGLDERTVEAMLMKELERVGEAGVTPAEIRSWSHLGKDQTTRLMARLVEAGTVVASGKRGVGSRYWLPGKGPAEGSGVSEVEG